MANRKGYRMLVAVAAITSAATIAACGSSAKSSSTASSIGPTKAVRYGDCMPSHGVPNFPDPGTSGAYSFLQQINPSSPAVESAQQACAKYGDSLPEPVVFSESRILKLITLAHCMRAHGVPNFPDPASTNVASEQLISQSGIDPQSPAFKHAAALCGAPGLLGS